MWFCTGWGRELLLDGVLRCSQAQTFCSQGHKRGTDHADGFRGLKEGVSARGHLSESLGFGGKEEIRMAG